MAREYLVPGWLWFVKDGKVYWGGAEPLKADVQTFRPLSDFWGCDAETVFSAGSRIRDADAKTFHVFNRLYAKDCRRAYTLKGPIPEADAETFEAIGPSRHAFNTTNGYARDRHHVFHTIIGGKACILRDVAPAEFVPCGHGYGRDRTSVFFERKKLPGATPEEWEFLQGPYSRSGQKAFMLGERIRKGRGETFESLPILEMGQFWARDGQSYFFREAPADPAPYLDALRQCFVFVGRAVDASLTWGQTLTLDPLQEHSWQVAQHARISVVCNEWLHRPPVDVTEPPEIGKACSIPMGLHLDHLCRREWMHDDRIWILRAQQDPRAIEKRLFLSFANFWWEYSDLSLRPLIEELLREAS